MISDSITGRGQANRSISSTRLREPYGNSGLIGVVSSSNPEMDHLAAALCRDKLLSLFVRRYVNKNRLWERVLSVLLGSTAISSISLRRPLLAGLDADKVMEAGTFFDFASAFANRSGFGEWGVKAYWRIIRERNSAIERAGARILGTAHTVIGNYGVSRGTFEKVKAHGGRTVLNYPNAHHGFSTKFLAEEAELEPEFASTITKELADRSTTYERECALADTILVGSSFVQRTFVEEGLSNKDIVVVSYGIDASKFSPSPVNRKEDGVFRAVFVGQLTQRKGISYLLRAYERFRGPGTELAMAGRFVSSPSVFHRYAQVVNFLGNLNAVQLAEVYRKADVFVFPTLLEGMPLVVLEAMASGLPVVTTSHGPGDVVRDGIDGFIVPIRDPDAIANRLEYLRANPEVRREMGRCARARSLEYTWAKYYQKISEALELKLMEGGMIHGKT